LLQFDANGKYLPQFGVELDQEKYMGMFSKGSHLIWYHGIFIIARISGSKKYLLDDSTFAKRIDTDTDN
jgi:hypothetical protein